MYLFAVHLSSSGDLLHERHLTVFWGISTGNGLRTVTSRGGARGYQGVYCTPKIFRVTSCHRSMSFSESPTQTIDSSPCCKTGPSSAPPQMKMSGSTPGYITPLFLVGYLPPWPWYRLCLYSVIVRDPTVPKALRAGVWEGLVNGSHTANAPLLICSPVTILGKPCNKQTCLTY